MGYGPHGDLDYEQYQKYLRLGGTPDKPKPKPKPLVEDINLKAPNGKVIAGPAVDPIRTGVAAAQPAAIARRNRERSETLRRQRILRANGYGVVVDGIWGPRSQNAWNRYNRGAGRSVVFDKRGARPYAVLSYPGAKDQAADELRVKREQEKLDAAADRRAKQLAAERAAMERRAAQRALILQRTAQLQRNPASAARMSLAALTAIVIDPAAKFNPARNRQAALAVQYNLRAKGFRVPLSGVFDKNTYTALQSAYRRAARNETLKRNRAIRDKLYAPLHLRVGQKPHGFPLSSVPTPAELDTILQGGGMTAKLVQEWFQREIATEPDAFATARLKQLEIVARDFQPFMLPTKLGGQANLLNMLGAIYGVNDLAHRTDLSHLSPEEQRKELAKRARDPNTKLENAAAIMALRDQVNALVKARDPKDFANKLAKYEAVSEEKFKRIQAKIASESVPWWGKALEKILVPGEFMRTALVYDVMRGAQLYDRLHGGDGEARNIIWEDAAVVLGANADELPDYDNLAKSANGLLNFGFSVVADPLNFVTPFKWGSMAAKTLTGSTKLGGFTVRGAGLWEKALVYEKGTWSKAALLGRVPGAGTISETAAFRSMREWGQAVSSLKEERMKVVSQRLTSMARHGFERPKNAVASKLWKQAGSPKNLEKVKSTRAAVIKLIEDPNNQEFVELLDDLKTHNLSIYVDAERSTLSNVGASLLASLAEKARVAAAHQFGTDVAAELIEKRELRDLVRKFMDAPPKSAEKRALGDQLDRLNHEIISAYTDTVQKAGVYITGGTGDVAVGKEIMQRTIQKMDMVEDVFFPALQDIIDRNADEVFNAAKTVAREADGVAAPSAHPLWDDEGLWAGRFEDSPSKLRKRAKDAFADENLETVANPSWGVGHTADEMVEAMDWEIRRALPRIYNWAARQSKAQGRSFQAKADELAEKEKDKILKSWEQRSDGLFYDNRKTVKVNKLYARNFRQALVSQKKSLSDFLNPETGEVAHGGIERLAMPPSFATDEGFLINSLDDSLSNLMWTLGSRYRFLGSDTMETGLAVATGRRMRTPRPPRYLSNKKEMLDWLDVEYKRLGSISRAFSGHRVQLSEAADSMLPGELVKEKLYMQALSRAQSKYAKAAYFALNGSMQVWKFATLPLRPGWVVRNTVDNFAKAMIASVRDPRLLFLGGKAPGSAIKSIFHIGVYPLRQAVRLFDALHGTNGLEAFDRILGMLWEFPADILSKLMGAHALPNPPAAVLDGARFSAQAKGWRRVYSGNPFRVSASDYEKAGLIAPDDLIKKHARDEAKRAAEKGGSIARLHYKMRYEKSDTLWELMADRPENYWKRVIYRSEVKKKERELRAMLVRNPGESVVPVPRKPDPPTPPPSRPVAPPDTPPTNGGPVKIETVDDVALDDLDSMTMISVGKFHDPDMSIKFMFTPRVQLSPHVAPGTAKVEWYWKEGEILKGDNAGDLVITFPADLGGMSVEEYRRWVADTFYRVRLQFDKDMGEVYGRHFHEFEAQSANEMLAAEFGVDPEDMDRLTRFNPMEGGADIPDEATADDFAGGDLAYADDPRYEDFAGDDALANDGTFSQNVQQEEASFRSLGWNPKDDMEIDGVINLFRRGYSADELAQHLTPEGVFEPDGMFDAYDDIADSIGGRSEPTMKTLDDQGRVVETDNFELHHEFEKLVKREFDDAVQLAMDSIEGFLDHPVVKSMLERGWKPKTRQEVLDVNRRLRLGARPRDVEVDPETGLYRDPVKEGRGDVYPEQYRAERERAPIDTPNPTFEQVFDHYTISEFDRIMTREYGADWALSDYDKIIRDNFASEEGWMSANTFDRTVAQVGLQWDVLTRVLERLGKDAEDPRAMAWVLRELDSGRPPLGVVNELISRYVRYAKEQGIDPGVEMADGGLWKMRIGPAKRKFTEEEMYMARMQIEGLHLEQHLSDAAAEAELLKNLDKIRQDYQIWLSIERDAHRAVQSTRDEIPNYDFVFRSGDDLPEKAPRALKVGSPDKVRVTTKTTDFTPPPFEGQPPPPPVQPPAPPTEPPPPTPPAGDPGDFGPNDPGGIPAQFLSDAEITARAHEHAWDVVTDTLFDYSKMSVAEDSLRVFFPFIQFWRKNTAFWVGNLVRKPWLDNAILQFDQARQDAHRDLPKWMQRYIHTDEIVDAASHVPGLAPLVEAMLPDNMQIDPMSFLSFAPLQRAYRDLFYGENQNLPPDEKGMFIIGPMIRAINDWGLGLTPFVRKPLEAADIVDSRGWQMVFPQTSLAVAFTMPFVGQERAFKIADWERIFSGLLGKAPSKSLAENFDFYVNQEIANQVAKGEQPNREVAEATIRALFYTQQLWGYFGGTYWRRATPEDIYISKLQDDVRNFRIDFDTLSDKDKSLLKLWSMRGADPESYDRYLTYLPMIEAYYREPDWTTKAQMIQENPALATYIDTTPQRKGLGQSWIRNAQRYTDTSRFFTALDLANAIDAPPDVKAAAYDIFVTPELRDWWKRNDTPAQVKDRMVQGQIFAYMRDLQKAYFKIPETDHEARDGFLQEHPELVQHWNRYNHQSGNYDAIMDTTKAALRDIYFNVLEKEGFDKAAPILKQFPFMFEGTKSEKKVKNGEWIGSGSGSHRWSKDRRNAWAKVAGFAKWFFDVHMKKVGEDAAWEWLRKSDEPKAKLLLGYISKYGKHKNGDWSAARVAAFGAAKPHLKWFFEVYMKRVGEKQAWAWLEKSDTEAAKLVKDYLKKYGKGSQKSTDYMKAKPWLAIYEGMPYEDRQAWLDGDSEGAKIVRWFFDKYSNDGDMSARAKAWRAVKKDLDYYGSLPKEKRTAWLDSADPRAVRVKDFFKKYGKDHQFERAFKKLIEKYPQLAHGTPEQAERIRFWKQYYSLPADQRPAFVHQFAEESGVFIYGDFSETYRHDREREFLRRAVGLGVSERAAAYLYVKPLLDFYRTIGKEDRPLFLRANPELQEYFDKYVKRSLTGDKKLDVLVEKYFDLAAGSRDRSEFLREHPEVQDFFDAKASPAERAMRALLEQYFEIPSGPGRDDFMLEHPEVQEYFDRRREEKRAEKANLEAFDDADPRLRPFFANASDLVRAAERERERLKASALRRLQPDELLVRRERAAR